MTAPLRNIVGNVLVVGLGGTELTSMERAWLRLVRPAGIILFRRNIETAPQTRALLAEATALCSPHSLRCVDVEGGTVDRLRNALASLPSAQAVANAARHLDRPSLMREHGELAGRAVKAFGFNTTLAPVLDLALPASAHVMGTRAADPTPAGVVEYARGFLAGLAAQGVVGCGKHFPGLGSGAVDSHAETPAIHRTFGELSGEDLAPYRALRDELPMVMVNHAAYPQTPGRNKPATTSAFWVTTVLRKRIGYRGLAFSDDLEMGGILKFLPIEEAAVAAVRAGMDLLEICHSAELILRAYEALLREAERSQSFRALLAARVQRTNRLRARLFADLASDALSSRQFEALRTRINRFSETILKAQSNQAQPNQESPPA
jgi:beta-N-acetylhexosaminidase